jgi:protein-tyrosine phosphatase
MTSVQLTATELVPNLWIGNANDLLIAEFIKTFDVIINCTKNIPFPESTTCKTVRVFVDDNLDPVELDNLYKYFDKITQYIHAYLLNGRRVFVHCYAGKQRSASIIVAYYMRYFRMSLEEATTALQSKRSIVFEPLCNFRPVLERFETRCSKK